MPRPLLVLLLALGTVLAPAGRAQTNPPPARPDLDTQALVAQSLHWQTGTIRLRDGLADLNLSPEFRYLGPADARRVLTKLWGNPDGPDTLGMIFPADVGPLDAAGWGVIVEYEENGYVRDDDADKINYDDLLKEMQAGIAKDNPEREKQGYPSIQLMGWAAPPRYDQAAHKLYWAKDLRFANTTPDTLNYGIRILGRRGVLVLNAVAGMNQLAFVEGRMSDLLPMINFNPGSQYSDFDPKVDKVAKYGLAALIAGGALGAAAKFGLLKFLWVGILYLKKFILVAVLGAGALLRKLLGRNQRKVVLPSSHPPPSEPPPPSLPPAV